MNWDFDIAKAFSGYQNYYEESPVRFSYWFCAIKENGVDSTWFGFEWNETDILGLKLNISLSS